MGRLAIIVIFLMVMLAIVPPMFFIMDFTGSELFPKVYNIILFLILTCVGVLIPYTIENLQKQIKVIPLFMAGWFGSMLLYEVQTIFAPEIILQNPTALYLWFKYVICFLLGITGIVVHDIIKKWN